MSFSPAGFSPLEAYEELMRFANKFGEVPLRLALHAAVPQSFRCDLLHLIKQNFVPEAAADSTAEADVLFSPLCVELGRGYFQFDPQVRLLLLDNLAENYDDQPRPRIERVADFLLSYVNNLYRNTSGSRDRLWLEYLETQRWIALAFINPDAAAQQLADALNEASDAQDYAARIQLGAVASSLTTPLGRYMNLLNYALALQTLETEGKQRAQELFGKSLDEQIEVGSTTLPPVQEIIERREGTSGGAQADDREQVVEDSEKFGDIEDIGGKPVKEPESDFPYPSPTYTHDVFISYAHSDDVPLSTNGVGWVTQFYKALENFLLQALGREIRIFRGAHPNESRFDFQENDLFIRKSKVFIAILSPEYIKSDWCVKELQLFTRHAEETAGISIGNNSRVFKVVKSPVEQERMPSSILNETIGYNFFKSNIYDIPREYNPEFGEESEQKFHMRVSDLAYDMAEILKQFEVKEKNPPLKNSVYLAQPTIELREHYSRVRRNLLQLGFDVVPPAGITLPMQIEPLERFVRESLSRCRASVHLLGEPISEPLEDDDRAIQLVELELAEERASQSNSLVCLAWMPSYIVFLDPRQRSFINRIRETNKENVKVFRDVFEKFESEVHHILLEQPPIHSPSLPDEPPAA